MLAARIQEPSVDFACDVTAADQRFRVLGVIDGFTKQSLVLDTDTCFPSRRVTRVLDRVVVERGMQLVSRCDNGPELTSRHFLVDRAPYRSDQYPARKADSKCFCRKFPRAARLSA